VLYILWLIINMNSFVNRQLVLIESFFARKTISIAYRAVYACIIYKFSCETVHLYFRIQNLASKIIMTKFTLII